MVPNAVLTGLISSILEDQKATDFVAVAADRSGRNGITTLLHALAQLAAFGVPVNTGILYRGRVDQNQLFHAGAAVEANNNKKSKLLYRVNGMKIERVVAGAGTTPGASTKPLSASTGDTTRAPAIAMSAKPSIKATASSYMTDPSTNINKANLNQTGAANVPPPTNGKKVDHGDSKVPVDTKLSQVAQTVSQNGEAVNQYAHPIPNPAQFASQQFPGQNFVAQPAFQNQNFNNQNFNNQNFSNQSAPGVDQLMMHYQQVMLQMTNSFVMSQQQVMLNYLQSRGGMQNQMARPVMPMQQIPGMQPMQGMQQFAPPGMQQPAQYFNQQPQVGNPFQSFGQMPNGMMPAMQQFNQMPQVVQQFQSQPVISNDVAQQIVQVKTAEQKFENWKAGELEQVKSSNGGNGSNGFQWFQRQPRRR